MDLNKQKMSLRKPLIVILGSTGTGKTKLSLELAKKFGGEIIGADSMQIYKKLDVLSAKPTLKERSMAPHHLIDILEPHETCTVVDYRNKAVSIIDNLLKHNKVPIIAGGTNYYVESILWRILVEGEEDTLSFKPWEFRLSNPNICSEDLHKKLTAVDSEMAKRLHPNNKRKIIRYLEICQQKGRKASEILKEQQTAEGASSLGGGLRYKNALIFWLKWEQTPLDQRLNERVDSMIEQGLLQELIDFQGNTSSRSADYTQGINQMIGPKEFHEYLMLTPEQRQDEMGRKLFEEGVERLKLVTRRYAKKQIKWIKNRFLGRVDREAPPLYGLNLEDIDKWDEQVLNPAIKIVESYMNEEICEIKPMAKIKIKSMPNALDETYRCEICQRVFVGQFQWDIHNKSRKHKKVLAKKKKIEICSNKE